MGLKVESLGVDLSSTQKVELWDLGWYKNEVDKREKVVTLQSRAYLRARTMAAFLSRSDSNTNTKDCPFLDCQNNDLAATFPPPLNPHIWNLGRKKDVTFPHKNQLKS